MYSLLPKNYYLKPTQRGFTLIELLIVIAIIAILAGVVFVSLDPLTRFRDARDASRWTDVTAILSAIKVDQVDNRGSYLAEIAGLTQNVNYVIGEETGAVCDYTAVLITDNTTPGCRVATEDDCVDLGDIVTEGYLGRLPINSTGNGPTAGNSWDENQTGYYIRRNQNNSVSIGSCDTESEAAIEVTR